ncbi:SH3 domain-containing protein [Oceanobacillus halophilus]|nr:SH3 domain-containing protein [Oceanobacillus halophilus]
MNRKKGLISVLLIILVIAFVAFVAVMQHNFKNQDFASAETSSNDVSTENTDTDGKDVELENEKEETAEDEDISEAMVTTQYVSADLLNVRSGPSTEDELVATLTLNDEVEVEYIEDADDWVKITTDDITGYVNSDYLSDEEQ